jgi:hypothetical protein
MMREQQEGTIKWCPKCDRDVPTEVKRSFGSESVEESAPKAYKRTLRCKEGHEWDTLELPAGYVRWLVSVVHAGRQLSQDGDRLKPGNTCSDLDAVIERLEEIRDQFNYEFRYDEESKRTERSIDHGERLLRKLTQGWSPS